mgnify:CR=1 FL=1
MSSAVDLRVKHSVAGVFDMPLGEVVYREDLYPRIKADPATIQRYAENLEVLPPIEINQHGILIDGFHRWTAHKKAEAETIKAFVTETASEAELYALAIERNAAHGLQMNDADKRAAAKKLFPHYDIAQIARLLSVSELTVTKKYLADEIAERTRIRNQSIIRAQYEYGAPGTVPRVRTQEEIAEIVTAETGIPCSQSTVARVLKALDKGGSANGYAVEAMVNEALNASKPDDDGGVDGITPDGCAIQTTIEPTVSRAKVDALVAGMERHGLQRGLVVGKRLSSGAKKEIERLQAQGVQVEFTPLAEVIEQTEQAVSLFKKNREFFLNKYLPLEAELSDVFTPAQMAQWQDELQFIREADFSDAEFSPPLYNIWTFSRKSNSVSHFGNSEQRIVENLLYLYTEPFDIVVDPFAGGGSTIDVCQKRLRRYWVSDRKPIVERENEIRKHDITEGLPPLNNRWAEVTLTYLDPPYWRQAEGQYSNDPTDLGNMPLEQFTETLIDLVEKIAAKQSRGVIALLIQPTQWKADNREFTDHVMHLVAGVRSKNLVLETRVSCPYSTEQYSAQQVEWAKANRKLLALTRELIVWRVRR